MSTPNNEELAFITCSYRPDLDRCVRLCQSMDQWVPDTIAHRIIVPARDLPLYRPLENRRRRVLAVEDVVPGPFRQLPGSERWWLDRRGWPVRGWIMQQVTKLSANFATDAELLLFADSDLQFLRPFTADRVLRGGKLRLHRIPGAKHDGEHLLWHRRACALLGTEKRYLGSDYVGQLITWRRSHLEALQKHLETVRQRPWSQSVARSLRVSEYILYGAFIEDVVGLENSGHYASSEEICHCCWFPEEAQALANGRQPLQPSAVAVLLQSNLGLTAQAEHRIIERVREFSTHTLEGLAS